MTKEQEDWLLGEIKQYLRLLGPFFAKFLMGSLDDGFATMYDIAHIARREGLVVTPVVIGYFGDEDYVIGGTWFDIIHRDAQDGNDIYFADKYYNDNGTTTKEASWLLKLLKQSYENIVKAIADSKSLDITVFLPFLAYVNTLYESTTKIQLATKLQRLLKAESLTEDKQEEFVEGFFALVDLLQDDLTE